MKTNLEKHKHYQKKSRYQFCEIPNDEEGQQLVLECTLMRSQR
jgi:hypothetical protein